MAWCDGPDSVDLYRNKHNPQPLGVVRKDSPKKGEFQLILKNGIPKFYPPHIKQIKTLDILLSNPESKLTDLNSILSCNAKKETQQWQDQRLAKLWQKIGFIYAQRFLAPIECSNHGCSEHIICVHLFITYYSWDVREFCLPVSNLPRTILRNESISEFLVSEFPILGKSYNPQQFFTLRPWKMLGLEGLIRLPIASGFWSLFRGVLLLNLGWFSVGFLDFLKRLEIP